MIRLRGRTLVKLVKELAGLREPLCGPVDVELLGVKFQSRINHLRLAHPQKY